MRKTISIFMCVMFLISFLSLPSYAQNSFETQIKAKSAILMDQTTGQVLYKKNENEKLYPASVTKIMTMLLIVEAIDSGKIGLNDTVTTSETSASKGGSQIWLKVGETMSVDEMLKATAVYSANDACTALGEYLAGSDEGFVTMMNSRAKELGMKNTHFDNCTGLDDETDTHLTTAYDIALMSRELMKHDLIKQYSTVWMDSLRDGKTELVNTNKLIRFYSGATGLKTGTTTKAGCCVSATATREGTSLIAVVLGAQNSTDRFESAKAMLNWGFANYETITPVIDKKLITNIRVLKGEESFVSPQIPSAVKVLVPKGRKDDIVQDVDITTSVEAPVESNQTMGTVTLKLDNKVLGRYNLTSSHYVDKLSFGVVFKRLLAVLCSK
ncbi:MAG: D-alanyl-D-alanine carboxypeptidase [Ruminococcus sp.]|nr:D-alanyl-D-alanine carboxypeptidase [Candidatus Copronaster equi]